MRNIPITLDTSDPHKTGEQIADAAIRMLQVAAPHMEQPDHETACQVLLSCLAGAIAGFHGDLRAIDSLQVVIDSAKQSLAEDAQMKVDAEKIAASAIATARSAS